MQGESVHVGCYSFNVVRESTSIKLQACKCTCT